MNPMDKLAIQHLTRQIEADQAKIARVNNEVDRIYLKYRIENLTAQRNRLLRKQWKSTTRPERILD